MDYSRGLSDPERVAALLNPRGTATLMSEVSVTANSLLKRLSRGMQALLLMVVALGATALLWAATTVHSATWKEFLNAIATGLLVSAAFGIAQALITSRVASELLRASVVEEVNRSLAQFNNAYFPSNEFPASSTPDSLYNSRLTQDLENSSTFWFRGLSARHTAARLALNHKVSLQMHIILPDPRISGTLEGRVDYAVRNELYPGFSVEGIRNEIKHDIALGLVGLFGACHRCALMELILTPMPLLDRYEIFRDAIWVTLYSDPGQGMKFPRALRFPASSVMYLMQQADCLQTRNHPSSRLIQFPRSLADPDMLRMFEDVTGETLTKAQLDELTRDFRKFAEEFAHTAGMRRRA
jgi:hypothetical protein